MFSFFFHFARCCMTNDDVEHVHCEMMCVQCTQHTQIKCYRNVSRAPSEREREKDDEEREQSKGSG